ncbi:MAG: hypothetical protein COB51_07935 [Moraxellaceae bacterium]|nr:MAG: hypothetical protein COB51_07935 [Moraxellaceae bacterium]
MRRKILIFVFISMLITVILSCAILALFNMRNTLAYAQAQQNFQVQSTISAINIGLSEGLIPFIDSTFSNVAANQGFVGGIVFDSDMNEIRAFPTDHQFEDSLRESFEINHFNEADNPTKNIQVAQSAYTLAKLIDEEGDIIGYLFLSFDNSIIRKAAQKSLLQALGIVAVVSVILLIVIASCMTIMIRPLLALIEFIHRVKDNKDFSLRFDQPKAGLIAQVLQLESEEIISAQTAFNSMVDMVEALLIELAQKKHEIDDILNSIEQGIFTFNIDQTVNSEHSAKAEILFNTQEFEKAKLQDLFDLDDDQMQRFNKWLVLCSTHSRALKQWKAFSRLSPAQEFTSTGDLTSIIDIEYRPITSNGKLEKIMVLGRDITKERDAETALINSRQEQEALMGRVAALINSSAEEIKDYIDYAIAEMKRLNNCKDMIDIIDQVDTLFRSVHTLKGHAGTLGFNYFSMQLAVLESNLRKIAKFDDSLSFADWKEHLDKAQAEHNQIIDMKNKIFHRQSGDRISIDKRLFDNLVETLQSGASYSNHEIIDQLNQLDTQSFDSYCQKYRNLIKRFA